jgi:hypothetical protein
VRRVLVLFFILFCTFLNGQNKISIRIYYSPDICYRSLISDSWIVDLRDDNEIMKYGNSIGTGIIYQFKPKYTIEIGIQYMTRGYQTKKNEVITRESDPVLPDKIKDIYSFDYLGFPIRLNFMMGLKRVRYKASIGIITNILLKQEWENILFYNDHTDILVENMTDDYNKIGLTPVICFGLGYTISKSFEIQMEPTVQYDFLTVTDTSIKTYLLNFGLNLSLTYNL